MPSIFGLISVVQIILELIRSAMTHKPITMFLTSLRSRKARSSDARRSRFTFACPFKYPAIISDTIDGISNAFRIDFTALFPLLFNSFFQSKLRKKSPEIRAAAISAILISGAIAARTPSIWVRPLAKSVSP